VSIWFVQYRFAVASGERLDDVQQLSLEAHPTLPRIGTDRSRNLILGCGP